MMLIHADQVEGGEGVIKGIFKDFREVFASLGVCVDFVWFFVFF